METSALRVFKAVSDTGSVTRAAERLNCVQSNVTARLKGLEEELGIALFHRASRGMVPTAAGRVLSGYAERILTLVEEAGHAARATEGPTGPLALGSMETTAAVRLPDLLAAFHQRHPAVDLTLVTGPTDTLVEAVLAFRLEGALVGGPVDHPDLVAEPVFTEILVLVRSRDGAAKPVLLAFRNGCTYRSRAERWLRESGAVPLRVMEFGSIDAILGCVAAGMGITVLPRAVAERHAARGFVLEELPEDLATVPTQLIRRAETRSSGPLTAFRDLLREAGGG
ncbi:MAG TPA: LysR family transcriptional regulator [Azospirillaceae bacterium]|nr:LysR family transcriptional regulator [Azospirillaceae bacterium]